MHFNRRSGLLQFVSLSGPVLAGLGAGPVLAADDPNPYYIGVSAGIGHDSNVFRTPNGTIDGQVFQVQGDTYYSGGLVMGIDQPFGRQHLNANANVKYNRYSHLTDLDNTSFGLNAKLDWEAMDRLSGTLSAVANQNLAAGNTFGQQILTKKNMETDSQFVARAQYGLVALWALEGIVTYGQIRYSAPEYSVYEVDQESARLGVKYQPSALSNVGLYVKTTHGRYPGIQVNGVTQTFDRNDVVVTASWIPTGQSSLTATASVGRQTYNNDQAGAFNANAGSLTWNYKPTGKLSFATTISRDTGVQSSFSNLFNGVNNGVGDSSHLTTAAAIDATYLATAKVSVNGGLRYAHRSLDNSLTLSGVGELSALHGSDTIQTQYLGLTYTPLRSLQLGCTVGHDARTVSDSTPLALSYPYSNTNFSCTAQFVIQ